MGRGLDYTLMQSLSNLNFITLLTKCQLKWNKSGSKTLINKNI